MTFLRPRTPGAPRTSTLIAALLSFVLAVSAVGFAPGDAAAQPTRAELERAEARLRSLEADFDLAVDDYNAAQVHLDEVNGDIAAAAADVEAAETGMAGTREVAARVARELYTGGAAAQLETLLAAGDVGEAQRRFAYLDATNDAQDATFERLAAQRTVLDADLGRLAAAKDEAAATRARLAQLQDGIETKLASQSGEIERLQAEIAAAERARREREEAARRERERREAAAARARETSAAEQAAAEAAAQDAESDEAERDEAEAPPAQSAAAPAAPAPEPEPEPAPEPPEPPAAAPVSAGASGAVQWALAQVGKPYVWGGTGPNGFDCSGLTSSAWSAAGVSIPRTSRAQFSGLQRVSQSQAQPGDLIFFGSPVHHVGMYIGGGQMVHAPSSGMTVHVTSAWSRGDISGVGRPR